MSSSSAPDLRGSLLVRLGASAGGTGEAQQHITADALARALDVEPRALKSVVVQDLFVEQYHSDCPLPIGFSLDGDLAHVCNFLVDFQAINFRGMAVLLPHATSLVPYRLTGDNREKSAYTRAFIEQGISDVSEHAVSLDKESVLAREVARKREEHTAVSATRAEASQAIASLLRCGRAFDLSDGIRFKTLVLGRVDGTLTGKENAYLVLGITARPVDRHQHSETDETALALEALRVAESAAQPSAYTSEAEASDSPLMPLLSSEGAHNVNLI